MQRAFVTGATGLLGNNLVQLLLAKGWTVKALVRSQNKAYEQFGNPLPQGLSLIVGDLSKVETYQHQMAASDVLLHTAAYFRDSYTGGNHQQALEQINVKGTRQLLEAAYSAGIRKFVHVSSIAVLSFSNGQLIDETMSQEHPELVDDYYRSKIAADHEVTRFLDQHPDMPGCFVLPGWMHGPGDLGPTSAGRFILDYMHKRLPGVVDASFSFVDARDVAEVVIAASDKGRRGERYLAAGYPMHMRELLESMATLTGIKAPTTPIPTALLWVLAALQEAYARITGKPVLLSLAMVRNIRRDRERRFSAEKIKREFGIEFRSINTTLQDSLNWFKSHGMIKDH